jgi:hypothetical protein
MRESCSGNIWSVIRKAERDDADYRTGAVTRLNELFMALRKNS